MSRKFDTRMAHPLHVGRERETDRQTDRERQRQTGRQAGTHTDRPRQTDRQRETETDRQAGRQAHIQTDRDRQRETETDRQAGRQRDRDRDYKALVCISQTKKKNTRIVFLCMALKRCLLSPSLTLNIGLKESNIFKMMSDYELPSIRDLVVFMATGMKRSTFQGDFAIWALGIDHARHFSKPV